MDNRRLFLLLAFSFSLVMLWDAWTKHNQTAVPAGGTPAAAASQAAASPTPATTLNAVGQPPVASAAPVAAAVPEVTVRTDVLTAEVSAQGGDIVQLELTQHKATEDSSRNYMLFDKGEKHVYAAQSGLIGDGLTNHKTLFTLVPGDYTLKPGQDAVTVRLEAPEVNGVKVSKLITFKRGSYLADVAYEIVNHRATPLAANAYFQFTRDGKPAEKSSGYGAQTFTGPAFYSEAEKYQKVSFDDIAKDKAKFIHKATDGWMAMVQHYFVAGWIPASGSEREFFARKIGDDLYSAGVIVPVPAIAPGQTGKIDVPLYAGPQEQSKLEQVAKGFDLVVDYGWLTVIAAPVFWLLNALHKLTGNWGWAIILVTVLLKAAFFPLSAASYKSMAKMRTLAPRLQRLKEQYADDKPKLQQAMMEMYKREKVNPLGGCLPMLIQ
ncbi:MAG: membrane protein insertase YidC, partial [Zoogloea sp.]|nr:membrane protein insertase YidC [Zoogloea sp.]